HPFHRPPRNSKTDRLVNWKVILFTYGFIGTIESIIAFFMYFYTMYLGNVPPSKLLFAYEKYGEEYNV
uniref:Cation-transporting P-type ATPase C-terminal domain-containing protein n=1 Tax=Romanomermis culicivorax TaxID=13658 RepID=A0A915JUU2_ROMCU